MFSEIWYLSVPHMYSGLQENFPTAQVESVFMYRSWLPTALLLPPPPAPIIAASSLSCSRRVGQQGGGWGGGGVPTAWTPGSGSWVGEEVGGSVIYFCICLIETIPSSPNGSFQLLKEDMQPLSSLCLSSCKDAFHQIKRLRLLPGFHTSWFWEV